MSTTTPGEITNPTHTGDSLDHLPGLLLEREQHAAWEQYGHLPSIAHNAQAFLKQFTHIPSQADDDVRYGGPHG